MEKIRGVHHTAYIIIANIYIIIYITSLASMFLSIFYKKYFNAIIAIICLIVSAIKFIEYHKKIFI
jgi:hypothetical protein